MRDNVTAFVDKYKTKALQLNQFNNYFEKLDDGEFFYLLPNTKYSVKERLNLEIELAKLNKLPGTDALIEASKELTSKLFDNYEMVSFKTEKKFYIGEPDRRKRVCRFCDEKQPVVTFKNESHAISEALGNKCIIVNDECDTCNERFGKYLEPDFIDYLSIYITHFGIKGKEGVPKRIGENFEFSHLGNKSVSLEYVVDDNYIGSTPPEKIKLITFDELSIQNIYKTICKYALSVIDAKYIVHFEDTIEWLKTDFYRDRLPKVAVLSSYNFFSEHPQIIIYIRKNEDKNLPYMVGEFQLTFLKFVFIVPFCKMDEKTFVYEAEYKKFWDCFAHYNKVTTWKFCDFSDAVRRKVEFNFTLKKNEP